MNPGQFHQFPRWPVWLRLYVINFAQLLLNVSVVFLWRRCVLVVVVFLQIVTALNF